MSIGKFDILATYTYAHALLSGMDDDEAKQRGMVAAIMGAQARLGVRKEHHEEFQAQKEAAEKKKKTTITAESFQRPKTRLELNRLFCILSLGTQYDMEVPSNDTEVDTMPHRWPADTDFRLWELDVLDRDCSFCGA